MCLMSAVLRECECPRKVMEENSLGPGCQLSVRGSACGPVVARRLWNKEQSRP